jgi:hypothetical protein
LRERKGWGYTGRRVVRRIGGISAAFAALVLAFAAPAASARPPVYNTDPQANSPAGVVYSIPLDTARQDATPHGHYTVGGGHGGGSGGAGGSGSGGGGTGGGGSGTTGGGGSGTTGGGGSGTTGGGGSSTSSSATGGHANASLLVPGGQPGSLVQSANGFGSSSRVPGYNAPVSAGFRALGRNSSDAPLFAILLAIVVIVLGVFAGARSWRLGHPLTRRPLAALPGPSDSPPSGS